MPEDQELEPEAGIRASAIDEGIEEQTEDGTEENEKHDRASRQVGSSRSAGPPIPRPDFLDRTRWLAFARSLAPLRLYESAPTAIKKFRVLGASGFWRNSPYSRADF